MEIKKVIIVEQDVRKSAVSTVGRAVIGLGLLGPVGLLAGVSGKNKHTTTFQIMYDNGWSETKTVKINSREFKYYCQFL